MPRSRGLTPVPRVLRRPSRDTLIRVAVGIVAGLLTWQTKTVAPIGGVDGSWQAGIVMALGRGLRFGPEIDFTWGPLGFLALPTLYDPRLGAIGWVFTGAIHVGLCIAVALLVGPRHPRIVQAGLVVVGAIASIYVQPMDAVACLLLFALVLRLARPVSAFDGSNRDLGLVAVVAGACAVASLIKLNDAVSIVAIGGALAAGAVAWRRTVPVFIAAYAATFAVLWLLAGQRLSDIPDWLGASLQIVLGYPGAMTLPSPDRAWQAVALVISTGAAVAALYRVTWAWRPGARVATAAGFAVFWFLGYKHGFVRQPAGGFFAALLLVIVWMPAWRFEDRHLRWMSVAILGMAFLGVQRVAPADLNPLGRANAAVVQARTYVVTSVRVERILLGRARLRDAYAIPQVMLDRIGASGVHIAPYEAAVAWAYPGLEWTPLPVFQAYSAYTSSLDIRNAEALVAADGPRFVLRRAGPEIDSRSEWFEAPETMLSLACNFEQVIASNSWQLLERRPSRCSSPEPLGSITVPTGNVVAVPAIGDRNAIVVAHLAGISTSPLDQITTVLTAPPIWTISLTDVYKYRLVAATAGGPLIIQAAPNVIYPRTYAPLSARSFSVFAGPSVGVRDPIQPDGHVTVTFEAFALAPWADAGPP